MRIAVFCDGTWNSPDIADRTSVFDLSKTLVNDASRGQLVAYFPGIGTDERFDTRFQKFLNKYGGGVFGWGLDAKVKQAYQFISQAYSEDDEIYLFGFSRGAYTARSIAGMLRKCGIAADTSVEGINRAFALYRLRGERNAPDEPHILAERRNISPDFATSQKDLDARSQPASMLKIAYLGVWDTVGARGIPPSLFGPLATIWNSQYRFHDAVLSRLVKSARHAVATDERRIFFKPALWSNLDRLNGGVTGPLRPYQQVWFPGNHGVVGGSGGIDALSAFSLEWMVQGAGRLSLEQGASMPNMIGNAEAAKDRTLHQTGLLKAWRKAPLPSDDVHASALARMAQVKDYRPKPLEDFFP